MLQLLTGTGLAASAGMNAYIPLLVVGVLARSTGLVSLPAGWEWLSSDGALIVLGVLLAVELVADKIPAIDSANDVLQTAVRPTSGGLVFGAGSSAETLAVTDPGAVFDDRGWAPVLAGVVIALVVHALKALARPVLNSMTACLAAPVASTVEDLTSVTMSLVALLIPILVIVFVPGLVLGLWLLWRRWRRRRQQRRRAGALPGG